MEYHSAKPAVPLSKFIKQYWALENCIPLNKEHTQRIIPSGLPELIFYLGNKPRSNDKTKSINENSILSGHFQEFYDIKVTGKLSLISILFKPHGLGMFFDIPLTEIYNQYVPLKYLFNHGTLELETKLYEAKSFVERVKIIEKYLSNLLTKRLKKYDFKRIEHSVRRINQTRGVVNIDFLASEACYSRKQFERVFSHYVGTSPKKFLKTIRFQNSLYLKNKNKSLSITELAYESGYFDQAHFINDFKMKTGFTPKHYFEHHEAYSDFFE